MKTPSFLYLYKGKEINVYVSKRYQRNIYYRYRADGFYISCPPLTSKAVLVKGLDTFSEKLVERYTQRNAHYSFENDFIYLLGEKVSLSSLNIFQEEDLEEFLKSFALQNIELLVRKNEAIMGITSPYKIKIKKTVAQFGSNSRRTHTLSFQENLVHFSLDIIESVVIHELAHEFHHNHQEEFYNCVYSYCPSYKNLQRKLKKGIHL